MANDNQVTDKKGYTNLFSAFGIKQDRKNMVKMLNGSISLDLIFSFSIFGYISLEPLALTTVHIPVILAGMLAGPTGGALTGLVFGLTSMWKASVTATAYGDLIFSPFKSGMPAQSLMLSLGTRILFGWLAGLMFMMLFKKADKKWFGAGAIVISVVSTMLHSFLVSAAMVMLFPDAKADLLDSIAPTTRHFTVWVLTAILVYVVYRLFSMPSFLVQYRRVTEYKRVYKTGGTKMLIYLILVFVLVTAAIEMHSFDRLALIDVSDLTQSNAEAVNIALQQLLALMSTIYIIGIILQFIYDKGSIADAKLKQKEQEEIYQQKLRKTLDIMEAFTKDYEIVLGVDADTDKATLYRCSDQMREIFNDETLDRPFQEGGERFFDIFAAEDEAEKLKELTSREKVREYLKNDHVFAQVFKNKSGRYCETKIVPVSEHEFVCGYIDVDDSIREKMIQQEKLEKAMLDAEAANRAKSSFLLNMSHDIRTPMNAIIGYTDILAKYRTDEKNFNRCTENIRASGQYLLDLINNVLEMSRIESGVEELNEAPCDTRSILGSTYIVFREEAKKKGITFTYDRNVMHDYLYADKVKLQQIHLNIISNAVKYTNAGGSIKIISTELADEREGWCRIQTTTTDTGVGMSEEFLEHIYDDFARERNSTSSGTPGTGLGMGIVKRLVEIMGGEISIHSKKGEGTTVQIILPHRIAQESEVEKSGIAQQTVDDSLFKGKRILLAEDNELNAEIAAELLGDVGLEIDRAEDGIICISKLETAAAGYYDLILMDVQMPNMDGYQATKIIRGLSDKSKAEIPIIAMTANAFEQDRREALDAGMNDHISKPVSIAKLVSVMSRFISK